MLSKTRRIQMYWKRVVSEILLPKTFLSEERTTNYIGILHDFEW